jgi:alpha-glucosidase
MTDELVSVTPNVKPALLLSHPFYDIFKAQKLFVGNDHAVIDKWWGGPGSFIDFTNPKARELWKKMLKEHYIKLGIHSIWNDNNEYDSIFDTAVNAFFEGKGTIFAETKCI